MVVWWTINSAGRPPWKASRRQRSEASASGGRRWEWYSPQDGSGERDATGSVVVVVFGADENAGVSPRTWADPRPQATIVTRTAAATSPDHLASRDGITTL